MLVVQQALRDQHFPMLGSTHIAGWVIVHPIEEDHANLAALCSVPTSMVHPRSCGYTAR